MNRFGFFVLFFVMTIYNILAQESGAMVNVQGKDIQSLKHTWAANWITHPTGTTQDFGVYLFRNSFNVRAIPDSFLIYVSADNRFTLSINGNMILDGPARGDLNHWPYETIDIAPFLQIGQNVIAAKVVNFGVYRHASQHTFQTAFILQGASTRDINLDTNPHSAWKVYHDKAYHYTPFVSDSVGGYYAAGPGDIFYGNLHPWDWDDNNFVPDDNWKKPIAAMVEFAVGRGFLYGSTWFLVPRTIPRLTAKIERISSVVRQEGIEMEEKVFYNSASGIVIPAHTKATVLLDNKQHSIGFPTLYYGGGKDAKIKITYAEALFYKNSTTFSAHGGYRKGHRNSDWKSKEIRGYYDIIYPDGGEKRIYRPLAMRTYRFIQFDIETKAEALKLDDFYGVFTAYPFEKTTTFDCDNQDLVQINNVAWKTLQNSSTDNFIDPYYEQLQYIGDSRIEALVSIFNTNDDALMRNAIKQFDDSRLNLGLTCSRYPSYIVQIIPTYSLLWIGMLNDYYMYRDDPAFVKQFMPGILSILAYFQSHIDETGMLGNLEWWNFTDWAKGFENGIPPGADDGHSANVTLQYVWAIQNAIPMLKEFGYLDEALKYESYATVIQSAVLKQCYDSGKKLIAERMEKDVFSQHTNIFTILTNTLQNHKEIVTNILQDTSLIQSSIYFKFYLTRALQKAGMGTKYLDLLSPWKNMIDLGMTTFGETDVEPRSDCHGWSASPAFDVVHTITGIQSLAPGFHKILIEPNFGPLKYIKTTFIHPSGYAIVVDLKKSDNGDLHGTILNPGGLDITYKHNNISIKLSKNENRIGI